MTADVSHAERSWLKTLASENTAFMVVTADVFHIERSWLKT